MTWELGYLHGKVCCHTTFTSAGQNIQGMGRTTFSSCTIWKRYILECNHYLKEKGSVCKLRTLTLYKPQSINMANIDRDVKTAGKRGFDLCYVRLCQIQK